MTRPTLKFSRSMILLFLACLLFSHGWAHDVWIYMDPAPTASAGNSMIMLVQGHHFPEGNPVTDPATFSTWCFSPDGKKIRLHFEPGEEALTRDSAEQGPACDALYFENDIVRCKTTRGWKTGGRDKHPQALKCTRFYRSGLYVHKSSALKNGPAPDLQFHLTITSDTGKLIITCRLNGAPAAGIKINLVESGQKEQPLGQTLSNGQLILKTDKVNTSGLMLFNAAHTSPEFDSSYDQTYYQANLVFDNR